MPIKGVQLLTVRSWDWGSLFVRIAIVAGRSFGGYHRDYAGLSVQWFLKRPSSPYRWDWELRDSYAVDSEAARGQGHPFQESGPFRGRSRALRPFLYAIVIAVQYIPGLAFADVYRSFREFCVRQVRGGAVVVIGDGAQAVKMPAVTCMPLFCFARDKGCTMDVA